MAPITIVEVGPRDGLQNETAAIPTAVKVAFVNALAETGVGEIEVSSFVSPRKVPQLGDAEDVFRGIRRQKGVVYAALVPNALGLDRALAAGVDKVSVFTAVSETFNRKNINASVDESLRRFHPLINRARDHGRPVRGYVSTAFWCPFEGRVRPEAVVQLVGKLIAAGVDELSISDTTGKASPDEVAILLDRLLARVPAGRVAMHFHDTYGRGIANVLKSRSYGIGIFDGSVGGLGGCPFAPGATGNVATEAVVQALTETDGEVGVDRDGLARARHILDPFIKAAHRSRRPGAGPACSLCEFGTGQGGCDPAARSPNTSPKRAG